MNEHFHADRRRNRPSARNGATFERRNPLDGGRHASARREPWPTPWQRSMPPRGLSRHGRPPARASAAHCC